MTKEPVTLASGVLTTSVVPFRTTCFISRLLHPAFVDRDLSVGRRSLLLPPQSPIRLSFLLRLFASSPSFTNPLSSIATGQYDDEASQVLLRGLTQLCYSFLDCLPHLALSETRYRRSRSVSMKTEPAGSSSESFSHLSFLLGLLGLISRLYQRIIFDQDLSSLTTEPATSSSKSLISHSNYWKFSSSLCSGVLLIISPRGPIIYLPHLQSSSWQRSAATFQVCTSRHGGLLRRGSREST